MNIWSVILAGGIGARLAPFSTPANPKQFLDPTNSGFTLLQQAVLRSLQFTDAEKTITVGNILHEDLLRKQLAAINRALVENVILEPARKNTAAAVFLAAREIIQGIMVIMPSDHIITGNFNISLRPALQAAEAGKIVALGINPTSPNPNFGYIAEGGFFEKPDKFFAEELINKNALWNSGIYIAKVEVILEEFREFHPEFFTSDFSELPNISFDKAISEKTDKIISAPAGFEWADLGSFETLQKYSVSVKNAA